MLTRLNPEPRLDLVDVAGTAIAEDTAGLVQITLPTGSNPNRTVTVQAKNFGTKIPVEVVLTPDSGLPAVAQVDLDSATPGWVSLLSAPPYTPAGVASRPLSQAPGIRVVSMRLDANQELTEHTTPKRALVQMIDGTCDFRLGNEWQQLSAGDLIHRTPGLRHAVRAITRTAFLLFLIPDGTPAPAQQSPSTAPRLSLTTADDSLTSQKG